MSAYSQERASRVCAVAREAGRICSKKIVEFYARAEYRDRFNWSYISANKNICWEEIAETFTLLPWDIEQIAKRPDIGWDFVFKHLDFQWDWTALSENVSLTADIVRAHIDMPWDFEALSGAGTLNCEELLKLVGDFPQKGWSWEYLSQVMPIKLMIQHDKLPWEWNMAFQGVMDKENRYPIQFVIDHIAYDWDWELVSMYANLTNQDVLENLDFPWCWSYLLHNDNITIDLIDQLPKKPWTAGRNHCPKFHGVLVDEHLRAARRHMAAFKIQAAWRGVLMNPTHPIGKEYIWKQVLRLFKT